MGAGCSSSSSGRSSSKPRSPRKLQGLRPKGSGGADDGASSAGGYGSEGTSNPARPRGGGKSINPNQRLSEVSFTADTTQFVARSRRASLQQQQQQYNSGGEGTDAGSPPHSPNTFGPTYSGGFGGFGGALGSNNNIQPRPLQSYTSDMSALLPLIRQDTAMYGGGGGGLRAEGGNGPLLSHNSTLYGSTVFMATSHGAVAPTIAPAGNSAALAASPLQRPHSSFNLLRSHGDTTNSSFNDPTPRGERPPHAAGHGPRGSYMQHPPQPPHQQNAAGLLQQPQQQYHQLLTANSTAFNSPVGAGAPLNSARQHSTAQQAEVLGMGAAMGNSGSGDGPTHLLGLDQRRGTFGIGSGSANDVAKVPPTAAGGGGGGGGLGTSAAERLGLGFLLTEGSVHLASSHNSSYHGAAMMPAMHSATSGGHPSCAFGGSPPTKVSAGAPSSPLPPGATGNIRVTNASTNVTTLKRNGSNNAAASAFGWPPSNGQSNTNGLGATMALAGSASSTSTVNGNSTSVNPSASGTPQQPPNAFGGIIVSAGGGPAAAVAAQISSSDGPLGSGMGLPNGGSAALSRRRYSSIAEFESNCGRSLDRSGSTLAAASSNGNVLSAASASGSPRGGPPPASAYHHHLVAGHQQHSHQQQQQRTHVHVAAVGELARIGSGLTGHSSSGTDGATHSDSTAHNAYGSAHNLVRNFNSVVLPRGSSRYLVAAAAEANSDDGFGSHQHSSHHNNFNYHNNANGNGFAPMPQSLSSNTTADSSHTGSPLRLPPHRTSVPAAERAAAGPMQGSVCAYAYGGAAATDDDDEHTATEDSVVLGGAMQHRLPSLPGLLDGSYRAGGYGGGAVAKVGGGGGGPSSRHVRVPPSPTVPLQPSQGAPQVLHPQQQQRGGGPQQRAGGGNACVQTMGSSLFGDHMQSLMDVHGGGSAAPSPQQRAALGGSYTNRPQYAYPTAEVGGAFPPPSPNPIPSSGHNAAGEGAFLAGEAQTQLSAHHQQQRQRVVNISIPSLGRASPSPQQQPLHQPRRESDEVSGSDHSGRRVALPAVGVVGGGSPSSPIIGAGSSLPHYTVSFLLGGGMTHGGSATTAAETDRSSSGVHASHAANKATAKGGQFQRSHSSTAALPGAVMEASTFTIGTDRGASSYDNGDVGGTVEEGEEGGPSSVGGEAEEAMSGSGTFPMSAINDVGVANSAVVAA